MTGADLRGLGPLESPKPRPGPGPSGPGLGSGRFQWRAASASSTRVEKRASRAVEVGMMDMLQCHGPQVASTSSSVEPVTSSDLKLAKSGLRAPPNSAGGGVGHSSVPAASSKHMGVETVAAIHGLGP